MKPMKKLVKTKLIFPLIFLLAAVMLPAGEAQAAPGWITTCNYSHSRNDDPIVYPGKPGLSHLHDFIGATTTNASSNPGSMRAGGTTCGNLGDSSGYWVPALYKNGTTRVLPKGTSKHALFYYRRQPNVSMVPFPDGLKMIVGNAHAQNPSENKWIGNGRIYFKCGPGSNTHLQAPPAQCSSGIMVLVFMFPQCWDGKNLDSGDHISHMAYAQGSQCPQSHPRAVPRIEAFVRYGVGTGPIGTVTLASGPYYTAHADFFNAWDGELNVLVGECINRGVDCGTNP